MDEQEVREVFYEKLARLGDANEAVIAAHFVIANYILALVAAPRNDAEYWHAVHTTLRLKADLYRPEVQPGPPDRDPVPFSGRGIDMLMNILRQECEVLEYLHDHAGALSSAEAREKLGSAAVQRAIVHRRREQESIMRRCAAGAEIEMSRVRVTDMGRFADALIKLLLGDDVFERFQTAFNAAIRCLRDEYSCQAGRRDTSSN